MHANALHLSKVDRLRVMVVDDHEETRWVIRTILVAFGVQRICEAAGYSEALKKVKPFQPDIMLIDYSMPGRDGLQLIRKLRRLRDDPFVPIILMTSEATPRILSAARDAGATEFLAKPIAPASLRARLNEIILRPRNFISNPAYFGPDRRRRAASWDGVDRRKREAGPPPPTSDVPVDEGGRNQEDALQHVLNTLETSVV